MFKIDKNGKNNNKLFLEVIIIYYYEVSKKNGKGKKIIFILFIMVVVSISSIKLYDMYLGTEVKSYSKPESIDYSNINEYEYDDAPAVLEVAVSNIVGISKIKNNGETIFSTNTNVQELGIGSGVIISENGYIITNKHVAGNKYGTCYVTLDNGRSYTGSVVWEDSDLDLAIVKINMKHLNYMSLGNSDNIKVGQKVYAIGNPIGFEFQRTVTAGIISGINRTIKINENGTSTYMEDLIQTDATINPGNSGGALINENGEMIGINSVKITEAEGIGFAIPVNIVKPIIEKFINENKFEEGYIGIFAYDKEVIPYLDSELKLENGIYVVDVAEDGPARNSEIKLGDIITKIDDETVNKMSELRNYIYRKNPGDIVTLTILRNKKTCEIQIKLGKK